MFNFTSNPKSRQGMAEEVPAAVAQQLQGVQGVNGMGQERETAAKNPYVEQRIAEIEEQRIAFLQKKPDFDMRAEMQNPDFINYVWGKSLTVEEAYFLVHREEILEKARAEAMEELLARQERILENGAAKNRPATFKKSPKDLSDKEVDAIIERARNGEKITF